MKKLRILVVDDEEILCDTLKYNLETEGYDVDVAHSAEEALTKHIEKYNLLILDIMMGEISGFQLANILKAKPATAHIPIIFCTARNNEDDTVAGLTLGADDYISKPFSLKEVIARVKVVLKRVSTQANQGEPEQETIEYHGLKIDKRNKQCSLNNQPLQLTKKEYEILTLLLENKGNIFSREDILKRIWSDDVIVIDRTVDVTITRLRKKIGEYGHNIVTRHGYGYGFEA